MATVTNVGTWTAVSALAGYAVDDTIAYNWQDISGTGTAIPLTDNSMSGAIPLGFALDYFGTNYSDVYVSSNGFMTVLAGQSNGCCSGQPIPTAGDPDGVIAGWWEDLNPSAGGTVHYQTLGSAPNRVFIVQFTNVPHYSSGNAVTMQFKLFETTNVIEVHYQAAPSDGGTHSAGIENADGSAGVQWYYGTAGLTTPEAVQYTPTPVYSATDTDTATVTVLTPNINVNPLSLSSTQPVDTSWVLPMTVANTGQGNLTWQIAEEPVARPAGAAPRRRRPDGGRHVRRQDAPEVPQAQPPSCPTGVRLRPCSTTTARWSPIPVQAQAAPTPARCRPRSASAPTALATKSWPATASPTTSRSAAPAG